MQRKVVSPNDFTDLEEVEQRLADLEGLYNATAKPFQWKFTRDDLRDLLARIDRHEHEEQHARPETAGRVPQDA